jgi:hypothetical protein
MAKKKARDNSRDAGAIMQTGKTQHDDGGTKGRKVKGPGGGGTGYKPMKQDKPNKGGSYGTGPAKTGY